MKKIVIVGGSNGLGLSFLKQLHDKYDDVVVFDLVEPSLSFPNSRFVRCDLSKDCSVCFNEVKDADTLVITAGFGIVKPFENYIDCEIKKNFAVNATSPIRILRSFYSRLLSEEDIKCFVAGSIAGEIVSPLFSVYGAAKAALNKCAESLNAELEMNGSNNRITCLIAVSFEGTSFSGGKTNLDTLENLSSLCIEAMNKKQQKIYIDEELCRGIIDRYNFDRIGFAKSSYEYKIKNNRVDNKRKGAIIGYLSGTFDLFHVGHLNLLKRAKEHCDYLIVGVHESGSWKGKETFIPFEERMAIVGGCKYVDEVHPSFLEDSDAWDAYHYDKLFVGSDYKGSERFERYEKILKAKGVEIVYFPYTQGTSSTQLREKLKKN